MRAAAHQDIPGGLVFSVCGQICGQRVNALDRQAKRIAGMAGSGKLSKTFTSINMLSPMEHYLR